MSTTSLIRRTLLPVMLGLSFTGCLEHEVKTTISADGSCDRVISVTSDARRVPETPFPLPLDGTWDTTWAQKEGGSSSFLFTMKKHYPHFEDLSKDNSLRIPGKLEIGVTVRKRFRWFYTYFEYHEFYGQFTPFSMVPPTTVMTPEEIERYTYGDTTTFLKNKKDEWVARNLFEILHRSLVGGAKQIGDSALIASLMGEHKETIFRTLTGIVQPGDQIVDLDKNPALAAYQTDLASAFKGDTLTEAGVDAFVKILSDMCHTPSVGKLRDSLQTSWQTIRSLILGDGTHGEKFRNTVVMPGLLLGTNARQVEGASAAWSFEIERLSLHAYEMHAESRVVNVWAIWVAGLVGLVALAVLLTPVLRRRQAGM